MYKNFIPNPDRALWLDTETYSEVPIKNGVHAYAEQAEIMIVTYAFCEEPVREWDVTSGAPMPDDLRAGLANTDYTIIAQNSHFDRTVFNHAMPGVIAGGVERWRDTMILALLHSLPGALGLLCEILNIDEDKAKDKEGKQLIQLFCKPRPKTSKIRRATSKTHPEEWARFLSYAGNDIEAMREIAKKLPKWNYTDFEHSLWCLDQKINDRGFAVDVELAEHALAAVDKEQVKFSGRTQELTNDEVQAATQRDALLKHILSAYDVTLPDMQKSTLERRLQDPDLPWAVKELIEIRLLASMTSTSKYKTLLRAVSHDGRLRGTMQFSGANRTRRWNGRIFQPLNIARPTLPQGDIDMGIDAIKTGCADLLFDNVMELVSSATRGCIVAPDGKKLVISDLSNIEGRFAAWVAGEDWKLNAFRDFDKGIGHDLYKLAYARSFNSDPSEVSKAERQIGKVMELACLAPETLVLTHRGYVQLKDIKTTDQVWDGLEWVNHKGLVHRGKKEVINVDGVKMTVDHLILSPTGWKPASLIASNKFMKCLSLALASVSLQSLVKPLKIKTEQGAYELNAHAQRHRTKLYCITLLKEKVHDAKIALERKLARTAKCITVMPTFCKTTKIADACLTASHLLSGDAITLTTRFTTITAAEEFKYAKSGDTTGEHSLYTFKRCRALITQRLKWIGSTTIKVTPPAILGLFPNLKITRTEENFQICKKESTTLKDVYDLVLAGPRNRFTIKTNSGHLIVHNCGYEGGVGAFLTFAAVYGLNLDELADAALPTIEPYILEEAKRSLKWAKDKKRTYGLADRQYITCDALKRAWRYAHPAITSYWKELDLAIRYAYHQPGKVFNAGYLKIAREGSWLRIRLPSGACLSYPGINIDHKGQISYLGINTYTRKWQRIKSYSGKFFENVCQSGSRDVLAYNMPAIENAGYELILMVHDETVTETPDTPDYNAADLSRLLATVPQWAPGLPLAAAGFESYRYRKD